MKSHGSVEGRRQIGLLIGPHGEIKQWVKGEVSFMKSTGLWILMSAPIGNHNREGI